MHDGNAVDDDDHDDDGDVQVSCRKARVNREKSQIFTVSAYTCMYDYEKWCWMWENCAETGKMWLEEEKAKNHFFFLSNVDNLTAPVFSNGGHVRSSFYIGKKDACTVFAYVSMIIICTLVRMTYVDVREKKLGESAKDSITVSPFYTFRGDIRPECLSSHDEHEHHYFHGLYKIQTSMH